MKGRETFLVIETNLNYTTNFIVVIVKDYGFTENNCFPKIETGLVQIIGGASAVSEPFSVHVY